MRVLLTCLLATFTLFLVQSSSSSLNSPGQCLHDDWPPPPVWPLCVSPSPVPLSSATAASAASTPLPSPAADAGPSPNANLTQSPAPGNVGNFTTTDLPRFNYASLQANAKVVDWSEEAQDTTAAISESSDKYTIFPCKSRKWLVVMLDQEIHIDQVAVANHEFYSSTFRSVVVMGSSEFPPDNNTWIKLGEWEAEDINTEQRFTVTKPTWVKYVKVWLGSHYGNERFCTLSSFKVHGKTRLMDLEENSVAYRLADMNTTTVDTMRAFVDKGHSNITAEFEALVKNLSVLQRKQREIIVELEANFTRRLSKHKNLVDFQFRQFQKLLSEARKQNDNSRSLLLLLVLVFCLTLLFLLVPNVREIVPPLRQRSPSIFGRTRTSM